MILVDATVIILVAEDSPTEKMSTLIIQSLNFNLWLEVTYRQWRLLPFTAFLLVCILGACWSLAQSRQLTCFISHTVLMQVSGNVKYNSIFYFYFFKLLEKFQVLMYCAITVTSSVVWGRSLPAMDVVTGRIFLTPATWWLMHDRAYEMNLSVIVGFIKKVRDPTLHWKHPNCLYLDSMHCDPKANSMK